MGKVRITACKMLLKVSSQVLRDPSMHGRVRSSLIHLLVQPATIVAAQSECRNGVK